MHLGDKSLLSAPWKALINQIKELEHPQFPDFVRLLGEEFALVKFKKQKKTRLRKHLLNKTVASKLLTHYLLWVLMPNEDGDLMKFETSIENLYFVVYDLKMVYYYIICEPIREKI